MLLSRGLIAVIAGSVAATLLTACRCAAERPRGAPAKARVVEDDFIPDHRAQYLRATARARSWLDGLRVDPVELRAHGIKGKKKLVEQLDAYSRLWQVAPASEKESLRARAGQVAMLTYEDRYHDMASISDEWFKQDATSYLRAALLMERLGLDTTRYRREIEQIHRRLNDHLPQRGPHQRRIFHWYYQHFGLEEPFPLEDALQAGVIARRLAPAEYSSRRVYELTHEVYALYQYGDKLDVDPFGEDDKAYLRGVLRSLIGLYIERNDPDLVAELVECLHYLRMEDEPGYRASILFLFRTQNPDGSWGTYERQRHRMGKYVRQGFQLHTTLVAVGALAAVFDKPMPPVPNREPAASGEPMSGGPP